MMKLIYLCFLFGVIGLSYGAGGGGGGIGIGGGEETEKEEIHEPDGWKQMYLGRKFKIDCSHLEVAGQELVWTFNGEVLNVVNDGSYDIFSGNSSFQIKETKNENIGNYRCEHEESGKSYAVRAYVLFFKKLSKSTTAQEGDKVSLRCEVHGDPEPIIQWKKDGIDVMQAVNGSADRIEFKKNEKDVENATLVINEISQEDRGDFSCNVFLLNEDGMEEYIKNSTTKLRVKDIYAALWPFLGIVAEVVILCLVIFIYERKRMKNEYEESDTDQGPDQKGRK